MTDNPFTRERRYWLEQCAEKYGKAYASIIGTMGGMEYRAAGISAHKWRLLSAKLEGFRMSAVLVLLADEYNEIETDRQAEELVKIHRKVFREAIEKDEEKKKSHGL